MDTSSSNRHTVHVTRENLHAFLFPPLQPTVILDEEIHPNVWMSVVRRQLTRSLPYLKYCSGFVEVCEADKNLRWKAIVSQFDSGCEIVFDNEMSRAGKTKVLHFFRVTNGTPIHSARSSCPCIERDYFVSDTGEIIEAVIKSWFPDGVTDSTTPLSGKVEFEVVYDERLPKLISLWPEFIPSFVKALTDSVDTAIHKAETRIGNLRSVQGDVNRFKKLLNIS